MTMHHRSGKVVGVLVAILLFLLIPVWAAGHWVSAKYPTVAKAGENASELSDGGLAEESGDAEDGELQNASELSDASGGSVATADDGELKLIQAEVESLKAANLQLAQDVRNAKTFQSEAESHATKMDTEYKKLSADHQALRAEMQTLSAELDAAKKTPIPVVTPTVEPASNKLARTRVWNSTEGKTVTAEFVGLEGDKVLLSTAGKIYRVPMTLLIRADQDVVRQLSKQSENPSRKN